MDDDELSMDEIEQAYLRALQLAESAEALFPTPEQAAQVFATVEDDPLPSTKRARTTANSVPANEPSTLDIPLPVAARLAAWQVLEALLFVGGQPLTGRHLADILGGSHTHEQVDQLLVDLNQTYLREGRPYEIRLTEGGYRMLLKPEFAAVRSRVFGQGPKDVKLTQDALEMLAFVAYQQPVTREAAEETGKPNANALLRQLLRRELVVLKRDESGETYHTTKRFLDLFGLSNLDDLPQMMDFNFK